MVIPSPQLEKQVPFQVYRLSLLPKSESIAVLGYGGSGVGKTWFAGTAGDRTAIVDCGQSPLDTLKSRAFIETIGKIDPLIVPIRERLNSKRIPLGKAFDEMCRATDYLLTKHLDDFDTLIWDNSSAVRRFAMIRGIVINKEQDLSQSQTKLESYKIPIIAIQDYKMEMQIMEWAINTYIDACKAEKKNFIVLAHRREIFRRSSKIGDQPTLIGIRPDFTGEKSVDVIPAPFDEVWYFEIAGGGQYRMRTKGTDIIIAKTTAGAGPLNEFEVNPHFLKLLKRIRLGAKAPSQVRR